MTDVRPVYVRPSREELQQQAVLAAHPTLGPKAVFQEFCSDCCLALARLEGWWDGYQAPRMVWWRHEDHCVAHR